MDVLDQFLKKNSDLADEYQAIIEEMLDDGAAYDYAYDFLNDVLGYIEENKNITEAQIEAVENIRDKPSKGYYSYGG